MFYSYRNRALFSLSPSTVHSTSHPSLLLLLPRPPRSFFARQHPQQRAKTTAVAIVSARSSSTLIPHASPTSISIHPHAWSKDLSHSFQPYMSGDNGLGTSPGSGSPIPPFQSLSVPSHQTTVVCLLHTRIMVSSEGQAHSTKPRTPDESHRAKEAEASRTKSEQSSGKEAPEVTWSQAHSCREDHARPS